MAFAAEREGWGAERERLATEYSQAKAELAESQAIVQGPNSIAQFTFPAEFSNKFANSFGQPLLLKKGSSGEISNKQLNRTPGVPGGEEGRRQGRLKLLAGGSGP